MGCANPEGATGRNIARQIAIRAGCPVTTSGMTVNRFCSSGLQTIAIARSASWPARARSTSPAASSRSRCVQNEMNTHMINDAWLAANQARALLADAADGRVRGEALQHLARAAGRVRRAQPAARGRGARRRPVRRRDRADDGDHAGGGQGDRRGVDERSDGRAGRRHPRRTRRYEGVSKIKPAIEGGVISAGNASQFSDGAGVCVVMSDEGGGEEGADAARHLPRLRRRRLRAATRWASARCSRCRSCSSAPARRSRTSTSGS